ncbi:MAG TPA: TonB-dependent receptor [Caulobacteraceae bacterium]|nr:TonB-dependent receptor [Caulobacteraceae bacterium]
MKIRLCSSLLVGASALAFPLIAAAQTTPAQSSANEVVVTGSRVITNGNNSPTPLTVVNVTQMQDVHPATIADQLNDLPQFYGSQNQTSRAQAGSADGGNPNAQGNVLNLRNFGVTRDLILFDGHRVAPNSPNGTVDVDMIPQLLIQRVDVVTGGASAVYGSDAVTGVVNFITDTKFKGFKFNAQAGISQHSDGATQDVAAAWGGNIGDRGHMLLSYEFRNNAGIPNYSSRAWGRDRYLLTQLTNSNGVATYQFVKGATRQDASFGGTITSLGAGVNPYNNFYFSGPGVLSPVNVGTPVTQRISSYGSGSFFDPSIEGALAEHQVFGRFDYDLTDAVHFYVKGDYTNTHNDGFAITNPTYNPANGSNIVPVYANNPTLPTSISQAMLAAGVTQFGINEAFGGPTMEQYRERSEAFGGNWSIDTGFNGAFNAFGDSLKWEAGYIHSSNSLRTVADNAMNGTNLMASLDAVTPAGGGAPVCYVTTQSQYAGLYPGCVPFTTWGAGLTSAEANWIFSKIQSTVNTSMDDGEASITGAPLSTWAGPVNMALSGEIRRQSYQVNSSTVPATLANPLNCAGLRLISCNAYSLQYFQASSQSVPTRSISVEEAAYETDIPLLKDMMFARSLSLNGAVRVTNYSTSGTVWTWKVGSDWAVNDWLTLRGTRSRDIRAPTMQELYGPKTVGTYTGLDTLLNVNLDGAAGRPQPAGTISGGNPNLKPEVADTTTLGVVFRPKSLPGFSASIDYYDISVNNAIVNYNGSGTAVQNDCINSKGTSITCSLIVRPINCCTNSPNNAITLVYSESININRQFTRGVDMELNYTNRLFERRYNLRMLLSYQPQSVDVNPTNGLQTNNAGATFPKWRGTAFADMALTDKFKVSVQERWRGNMNWFASQKGTGATNNIVFGAPGHIEQTFYTNLNLSYTPWGAGKAEFYVNIQNLFDQQPALYASSQPFPGLVSVAPGDDSIGRYFTGGVRLKF